MMMKWRKSRKMIMTWKRRRVGVEERVEQDEDED